MKCNNALDIELVRVEENTHLKNDFVSTIITVKESQAVLTDTHAVVSVTGNELRIVFDPVAQVVDAADNSVCSTSISLTVADVANPSKKQTTITLHRGFTDRIWQI